MLVKIVTLFLIVMALLAMVGRLRVPGALARRMARRCPACGTPRVGRGGCPCGRA